VANFGSDAAVTPVKLKLNFKEGFQETFACFSWR